MTERRGFAVAVGLVVVAILCLRPGYIVPDALATWSWLRSLVVDGDLLFFNEWGSRALIRDGFARYKEITPVGALANHWWIGSAWVGAIPYLGAHAVAVLSGGWLGSGGLAGIYAWTLSWISIACLWLVWFLAQRIETNARVTLAFLCVVLGTPLFWYAFRFPTLSHLPAAAAVGAMVWCIWRSERAPSPSLDIGLGLALGLASAIRLQHALLLPAVVVALVILRRPPASWLRVAAGVVPFALMQAVAWYAVYGSVFGPLVHGVDPGGGTWAAFRHNAMLEVLASPWNGLFVWAPVTLLALAGWISELRARAGRSTVLPIVLIVTFCMQWIANGILDRWWWGGLSFGPRRWSDLAVPFVIGLVWAFRRWPRARVFAVIAAAWGVLLIAAASTERIDLAGPVSFSGLARGVLAIDWMRLPVVLFSPAFPTARSAAMSCSALLVVAAWAGLMWFVARRRRAVEAVILSSLGLCVWLALTIAPTRERAPFYHDTFQLLPERAELGALLDRAGLMEREHAWLSQSGDARATEVEVELMTLRAEIARRSRLPVGQPR